MVEENSQILKFVCPLDCDSDGVGVFVGNLFLTSWHIVESNTAIASIDGIELKLDKTKSIVKGCCEVKDDEHYFDIAVFETKGIDSPLVLNPTSLAIGDTVVCVTYNQRSKVVQKETAFGLPDIEEYNERKICSGKVSRVLNERFFECEMDEPLKRGNSGSPLFIGESVVGILVGDLEGKNESKKILFQSVNSVL